MIQNQIPANPGPAIRYNVRHKTHYKYSSAVAVCQNQLRMQPISGGNVTCHQSTITIHPTPTNIDEHFDYFGNRVQTFSIESVHRELTVIADSSVSILPRGLRDVDSSPPWESCTPSPQGVLGNTAMLTECDEHRYDSPRIRTGKPFADYAMPSFTPGRTIVSATLDLAKRIQADFKYDSNATHVQTTPEEAFELRAGVCQDFSHVMIACLRSLAIPARYVSGYLRTNPPPGKPRLIGADESHAWLEVYAGAHEHWVGVDPTNACLVSTDHIPIGVGRDYSDVSPMRGVVLGGGTPALKVSVDVEPVVA